MLASLAAKSLLIALAGAAFLVADTLPVAGVIALTENLNLVTVWREMLTLTFSYFVLSAGVAAVAVTASHYVGWQTPLLVLPVMTGAYVSYRRYFRFSAVGDRQPAVRHPARRRPREGGSPAVLAGQGLWNTPHDRGVKSQLHAAAFSFFHPCMAEARCGS